MSLDTLSAQTLSQALTQDPQWHAFVDTEGVYEPVTIGVSAAGASEGLLVTVSPGAKTSVARGPPSSAHFVLQAQSEQWDKFFSASPVAPYTSFVGLQVRNQT